MNESLGTMSEKNGNLNALFEINSTCCLVVSYRSAIKVATAFAPKKSVFQLWEEDA